MPLPILYSYRRCPYAMRARMALSYAGIKVEIREVSLNDKPAHMLQVSPKGTVPVLVLSDGTVIDQSLDVMHWALQQHDVNDWLAVNLAQAMDLIAENDGSFKQSLDRYKYAIRFPEQPAETYRSQCEQFLIKLERHLSQTEFLLGNKLSVADVAIFPFIRQFAAVDNSWFDSTGYIKLKIWLNQLLESDIFKRVMIKSSTYLI